MTLGAYLERVCDQKLHISSRKFFQLLGGQGRLGFTYRSFRNVFSDRYQASPALLGVLFHKLDPSEHKDLFVAFMETLLKDSPPETRELVVSYLRTHLRPATPKNVKSLYDSPNKVVYTESQLKYLAENPDGLRIQKRVLLNGRISRASIPPQLQGVANDLIALRLVSETDSDLTISNTLFQLPSVNSSSPALVRKRTEFLFSQLDGFISREDYSRQMIKYTTQYIDKSLLPKVREQLENVVEWVKASCSAEDSTEKVPVLGMLFFKELTDADL